MCSTSTGSVTRGLFTVYLMRRRTAEHTLSFITHETKFLCPDLLLLPFKLSLPRLLHSDYLWSKTLP